MKQIKTISHRLDNAALFDEAVNNALTEGWQLMKREVINPMSQHEKLMAYITIYAELEREIITEAEQCCDNCKHFDKEPHREPCCDCEDGVRAPSKWEPAE